MKPKMILILATTFGWLSVMMGCSQQDKPSSDLSSIPVKSVRAFETQQAQPEEVSRTINFSGLVVPEQKLEVISEQQGVALATTRAFKEGVSFSKGETLVRIDPGEFENNLRAQRSQLLAALVRVMSDIKLDHASAFPAWNHYLAALDVERALLELPEVKSEQLRYFLAANNIQNLYYNIKSGEDRLAKYEIKAPFTGTVTQSQLDIGNLIRPGVKLGNFIRTDRYEIKTSVSLADLIHLSVGQQLTFTSPDLSGKWEAVIVRIGKSLDQSSQAVTVYSRIQGAGLKEGMYLEGELVAGEFKQAVELPKTAITRSNQVYVIEDSVVKLKPVELLDLSGDTAWVAGLSRGDVLITEPITSPIQGIQATSK